MRHCFWVHHKAESFTIVAWRRFAGTNSTIPHFLEVFLWARATRRPDPLLREGCSEVQQLHKGKRRASIETEGWRLKRAWPEKGTDWLLLRGRALADPV